MALPRGGEASRLTELIAVPLRGLRIRGAARGDQVFGDTRRGEARTSAAVRRSAEVKRPSLRDAPRGMRSLGRSAATETCRGVMPRSGDAYLVVGGGGDARLFGGLAGDIDRAGVNADADTDAPSDFNVADGEFDPGGVGTVSGTAALDTERMAWGACITGGVSFTTMPS